MKCLRHTVKGVRGGRVKSDPSLGVGQMKTLVYETPVELVKDLVAGITVAAGVRDTPAVIHTVRNPTRCRCEACVTASGR